jgi:V/A-type H+-transporting ATPase subunit F
LGLKIIAVGSRVFVTGLRLAGIEGVIVDSGKEAIEIINRLIKDKEVGLVLLSDDISKSVRAKLNEIRSKYPTPLIYEVPTPGSKGEKFEYRDMLKQILGYMSVSE